MNDVPLRYFEYLVGFSLGKFFALWMKSDIGHNKDWKDDFFPVFVVSLFYFVVKELVGI